MAKYQVPQFLEVEDKIFGPLTFKQFLYLGGGLGLGFLAWTFLPASLAIVIGAPIVIFFIALAFLRINERPFIFIVENMFNYLFSKKLYLWRKSERRPERTERAEVGQTPLVNVPKLSESKLRSLSWELDVHESLEGPSEGLPQEKSSLRSTFKI